MTIKTTAVVGSGTMGLGIVQVFAQSGLPCVLFDVNSEALAKAKTSIDKNLQFLVDKGKMTAEEKQVVLGRLSFSTDFTDVKADLILEAIVEKLEAKRDLFQKLAAQNAETTVFATNTSTIPVTQIAATIPHPERIVGIHFFNPAHIMKLVEIISGRATDKTVAESCYELVKQLGKTPIHAADAPGFIVNRVARHYYVESLKIAEEQVCSIEDLDALMEASGFKMGPFKLMDLIGVDVNFSVTQSIYNLFHQDAKFRPSRMQQQLVDAGLHGRKTGRGFYEY